MLEFICGNQERGVNMSGLNSMKKRLGHVGGDIQNNRMIKGKLESFKRSMKASYAAATAIVPTGGEFSCLINPNKQNETYDNKVLSIPFRAPDLAAENPKEVETGVKAGQVIEWKENETFWLIYLPRLNEKAYFRADLKRCQHEIEVNGEPYKVATEFISPTEIDWRTKEDLYYNKLNYSLNMYITKDDNTLPHFKRFTEVTLNGENWQVQSVDRLNVEGVLVVNLKEFFTNDLQKEILAETEGKKEEEELFDVLTERYIKGDKEVYPYDTAVYTIENFIDGYWFLENINKIKIIEQNSLSIKLLIQSGKSGDFTLYYKKDGEEDVSLSVKILPI